MSGGCANRAHLRRGQLTTIRLAASARTDCSGGFQCSTAKVPLDYDHPFARTIEIALDRRPAADPANRIGSLFLNPGGPGGSAIEFVRTAPPAAFQLFAQFDVVGFDSRGLGASRIRRSCCRVFRIFLCARETHMPRTSH